MRASTLIGRSVDHEMRQALLPLMGYAAGDAFGVGYEFLDHKPTVDTRVLAVRHDEASWPYGGVSDDTHLTILSIRAMTFGDPDRTAHAFIAALRSAQPHLRGLGPTTRSALGMPVAEADLPSVGTTNGGMMRTALVGLAYPPTRAEERRAMVTALAGATHNDQTASACAVIASALFSDGRRFGRTRHVLTTAMDEARDIAAPDILVAALAGFAAWEPPEQGISLSPVQTLLAVIWVTMRSAHVADAYRLACELGGDTDTVAALSGALVLAQGGLEESLVQLPWIDDVLWSEIPELVDAARILAEGWAQQ